jgi:hypothetical protein
MYQNYNYIKINGHLKANKPQIMLKIPMNTVMMKH